jgi:hypothetical protein
MDIRSLGSARSLVMATFILVMAALIWYVAAHFSDIMRERGEGPNPMIGTWRMSHYKGDDPRSGVLEDKGIVITLTDTEWHSVSLNPTGSHKRSKGTILYGRTQNGDWTVSYDGVKFGRVRPQKDGTVHVVLSYKDRYIVDVYTPSPPVPGL